MSEFTFLFFIGWIILTICGLILYFMSLKIKNNDFVNCYDILLLSGFGFYFIPFMFFFIIKDLLNISIQ